MSIYEECIKGYSSYEFVQSVDSLIKKISLVKLVVFVQSMKKFIFMLMGLLTKELIQVMQQYGMDVPVSDKSKTKKPQISTKTEERA